MDTTRLDGKVFIVTGGAGGIGAETLRLAGAKGARLVVADINIKDAEELADDLSRTGPEAIAVKVDLTNEGEIVLAVKKIADHFGGIDVLNNNAAALSPEIAARDSNVEAMDTEVWDLSFNVNARGAMLMARECMPHLMNSKGNIVNTVSNLALQGHVVQCAYSASKAALIQLTRSIAASHGRKGVRCNAVAPGMTLTPALKEAFPPELRKMVEDETLRDQLGAPEEISEAIVWLASEAARNITGQILVADGGCYGHVPGFGPFFSMINQGA